MRIQEQVVRMTQRALDDVCRAARAVPDDKLDWSPMGAARSCLEQMREIAGAAAWFLPIVRDRAAPVFDAHAKRESVRALRAFKTLDACIEGARTGTATLCEAILALEDEHLDEEIHLPFGGGTSLAMVDVALLHHNNMVYHFGQINQIQLMLGDREMH